MVVLCAVEGCYSEHFKGSVLSFHRFPITFPDMLAKWLKNIGRINWTPKTHDCICSLHFAPDQFKNRSGTRRRLISGAIPTIFNKTANQNVDWMTDTQKCLMDTATPTVILPKSVKNTQKETKINTKEKSKWNKTENLQDNIVPKSYKNFQHNLTEHQIPLQNYISPENDPLALEINIDGQCPKNINVQNNGNTVILDNCPKSDNNHEISNSLIGGQCPQMTNIQVGHCLENSTQCNSQLVGHCPKNSGTYNYSLSKFGNCPKNSDTYNYSLSKFGHCPESTSHSIGDLENTVLKIGQSSENLTFDSFNKSGHCLNAYGTNSVKSEHCHENVNNFLSVGHCPSLNPTDISNSVKAGYSPETSRILQTKQKTSEASSSLETQSNGSFDTVLIKNEPLEFDGAIEEVNVTEIDIKQELTSDITSEMSEIHELTSEMSEFQEITSEISQAESLIDDPAMQEILELKRIKWETNARIMRDLRAIEQLERRKIRRERNTLLVRSRRALESDEKQRKRRERDALGNRKRRSEESEEERRMRLERDAQRARERRANETLEERKLRLERDAQRTRERRANETPEERKRRQEQNARNNRERRAAESAENRAIYREYNARRRRERRALLKHLKFTGEGFRMQLVENAEPFRLNFHESLKRQELNEFSATDVQTQLVERIEVLRKQQVDGSTNDSDRQQHNTYSSDGNMQLGEKLEDYRKQQVEGSINNSVNLEKQHLSELSTDGNMQHAERLDALRNLHVEGCSTDNSGRFSAAGNVEVQLVERVESPKKQQFQGSTNDSGRHIEKKHNEFLADGNMQHGEKLDALRKQQVEGCSTDSSRLENPEHPFRIQQFEQNAANFTNGFELLRKQQLVESFTKQLYHEESVRKQHLPQSFPSEMRSVENNFDLQRFHSLGFDVTECFNKNFTDYPQEV